MSLWRLLVLLNGLRLWLLPYRCPACGALIAPSRDYQRHGDWHLEQAYSAKMALWGAGGFRRPQPAMPERLRALREQRMQPASRNGTEAPVRPDGAERQDDR